ncbi:MAG: hypothetical protein IKX79_05215 [Desulfovibrionaceae bacterium]|nr:hypothetical protein [Desulfovibrionaceae bacterium]MBR5734917.1 hypothetical protein [Desulfovibrionaceae bacterium]
MKRLWLLPLLAAFLLAAACAGYGDDGPRRIETRASGVWSVGVSGGRRF